MKSRILLIILVFLIFSDSALAESKVQPEIRSVQKTLKNYESKQKVFLYIDLAEVYAKSNEWDNFYSKIEKIYMECPRLKKVKLTPGNIQRIPIKDEKDIIDPLIIKKLSKYGLEDINTKEKAIYYIELLKPLCAKICPLSTSVYNGPPPVPEK